MHGLAAAAVAESDSGGRCEEVSTSCAPPSGRDVASDVSTATSASEAGDRDIKEEDAEEVSRHSVLPALPAPTALLGVKSKRRPVLSIQMRKPDAAGATSEKEAAATLPPVAVAAAGGTLTFGLAGRAALAGLSEEEAASLCAALAAAGPEQAEGGEDEKDDSSWGIWTHEGLKVAVVSEESGASVEAQLVAAAAQAPHVVCVHVGNLQERGGACAILRNFKGALLIIENQELCGDDAEDAGLLRSLGVAARWSAAAGAAAAGPAALEPAPLRAAQATELLGDLKLRDLERDPELAALAAEAQPLYDQHFHEELLDDLRSWEGAQLGFLVSPGSAGDGQGKVLLGLIVYKFWGPPLRAMSILRVAVSPKFRMQGYGRQLMRWALDKARQKPRSECAKVTLCAMPEAVAFYERLRFARIPLENLELPPETEDAPRLPGSVWMEYKCGRSCAKPSGKR